MIKKTIIATLLIFSGILYFSTNNQQHNEIGIQCINLVFAENNIKNIDTIIKGNRIILTGNTNQKIKEKINLILTKKCDQTNYIDNITFVKSRPKHMAWIKFEIDEFNELITIHGVLKNQQQINDILTVFSQKFTTFNLANDIEFDVLIKRNHELAENLSYLLPSLKTIKVAKIKLSEKVLNLEGLVRNKKIELQTINQIKNIFSQELEVTNNLTSVTKQYNNIKPLEFPLPTIPLLKNKQID